DRVALPTPRAGAAPASPAVAAPLVLEITSTRSGRGPPPASAASLFAGAATGPVAPCVLVPGPPKVRQAPDGSVGG
ncbi:hypothetical protein AB0I58_44790, partial [Spirillospora sp. NPDC050365]